MNFRLTACLLILSFAATPAFADSKEEYREALKQLHAAQEKVRDATRELNLLRFNNVPRLSALTSLSEKPMIGVMLSSTRDDDGVTISGIIPDSPAEAAGIEKGDILLAVNGDELGDRAPLQKALDLLRQAKEGEALELEILNDEGDTQLKTVIAELLDSSQRVLTLDDLQLDNLNVQLDGLRSRLEFSDQFDFRFPRVLGKRNVGPTYWSFGWRWSGLEMVKLNPDLGRYFQASSGALVVSTEGLEDDSLRPGDVILAVDGETVDSPEAVMDELAWIKPGKQVELEVIRDGDALDILMTSPELREGESWNYFSSKRQ